MSRGIHFVTTHVAISMAACMSSLGALGAWTPENKDALVARIWSDCTGPMLGPENEPISQWDVSKVTDMSEVFKDCKNFNGDISGWETSQVTDFSYVFRGATTFNQPLVSWNTEKALYFNQMFRDATAFNQPLGSWNTGKARSFHWMFKDTSVTSVSIKTTAYWDTTTAGFSIWKQLSQQPCPDGYVPNGGAKYGTVAVRCPGGCNVLGYYPDANGFCRNDCFVDHCEDCTTDRETTCDTCTGGYAQYAGSAACVEIKVCSTATGGQCLVCKNVNECEAGQCNPGYQFDAQCTACPNPGIGEKFTATAGSCFVTPCPAVAGEYYTTNGDCTKMSCTKRDSNQYYDKNETITSDDCSVATCPTDQTPAADGLSCEDETKSKVSETGDDAMIGTIMISETGDDAMIGTIMIVGSVIGALVLLAVVGIVVFCVIKRKRKNKRRDLGNRESKFDVELEAVTNNDEPVSRPSPSIEYREKEL